MAEFGRHRTGCNHLFPFQFPLVYAGAGGNIGAQPSPATVDAVATVATVGTVASVATEGTVATVGTLATAPPPLLTP